MSEDPKIKAERSEAKTEKIDGKKLPIIYRLILKLPIPAWTFSQTSLMVSSGPSSCQYS